MVNIFTFLAAHITERLIDKGYLSRKDDNVWKYALVARIEKTVTFAAMLLLSFFLHNVFGLAIYLVFLSFLRQHTGGFHAKTFRGCFAFTLLTYGIVSAVSVLVEPSWQVCLLFLVAPGAIILGMAPQNHPNYNGSAEEMACHRRYAVRLLAVEACLIGIVCIFAGMAGLDIALHYALYADFSLITVAMCLILGKLFRQDRPAATDAPE